jgi:catechol 1,2-dioxygenase
MSKSLAFIAAFLLSPLTGPPPRTAPSGLVGTWQLLSRADRDSSGRILVEPSLGSAPLGFLIYDAAGHIAVQLMARDRASMPCAITAAAQTNNATQITGYEAYFGRYEVDAAAGVVTHVLQGALSSSDVGRRLTRRFHLVADTLTLQFEPGGPGRTRTLVWRRVAG